MKTTKLIALAFLTFLAPMTATFSQEAEEPTTDIPLLKVSELVLAHYTPRAAKAHELQRLASNLIGRQFYVVERGGIYNSAPIPNISMLGDQLVLYDSAEYVKRLRETLEQLDRESTVVDPAVEPYVTTKYVPRSISLDSALAALEPLASHLSDGSYSIAAVKERRTLVLRDTASRLEEMTTLLEAIDVPEEQVRITCYLLQGKAGQADSGSAPRELLSNLKQLLPDLGFESIGFAMLQSGVVADRGVQLSVDGTNGLRFELSFQPVAYDSQTGSMTVRRCNIEMIDSSVQRAAKSMLSTDTVFRGGEYTVLGATGQDPIFFVVHVKPVR